MNLYWTNNLDRIPTPCYLIDKQKLNANISCIETIRNKTNCKIILALKGFATHATFPMIANGLDGVTASSIYEARLGRESFKKGLHIHSVAMSEEECDIYNQMADHITFNSYQQFTLFRNKCNNIKPSLGLRINPGTGKAPSDIYNPCSKNSRLGIPLNTFNDEWVHDIEGLHFHALCEEGVDALDKVLTKVEKRFEHILNQLSWVNWGGGHLLTDKNYDTNRLIDRINSWQKKYNITVILEPGEAIGRHCGYYVGTVLDIISNNESTAICDISITAHMPDVLEYPYRPEIHLAGNKNEDKYNYFIGGNTCLAGDVIGPYSFKNKLSVGDKLIFMDMGHYTIVKTSNFNGVKQPAIGMINESQEIQIISNSDYFNFKERLS
ncbi:MAG: carboxynorspermidine decarboxylase [Candidatus Marinamargulisbacteria bacterium]